MEGLWRRVKIGDFELEDEMAAEENEVPHKDGRQPKFTFSHITRDSNLLNPHLHKNHRYTTPNLHEPIFSQPQIYTTRFYTNPNIHSHKIKPNMRHWVSHKARVFSRPKGPALVPNQRMDNVTPIYAIWDQYNQGSEIRGLCKWGFCVNLDLCKSGFV